MGFLRSVVRLVVESVVVTFVLVLILAYLPTSTVFPSFPLEPNAYQVPDLTKDLNLWNDLLGQKSDLLMEDELVGPESLAQKEHLLYSGLADGRLVEVNTKTGELRTITRFSQDDANDCHDHVYYRLMRCGRPLGLRFDSSGNLLVTDAIFGLFHVNVTTGAKKLLALGQDKAKSSPEVHGLYNDLVVDPVNENIVYVSVSSTRWALDRVPWSLAEHENSGLLLAVDLKTGKVTKLGDGFYFTNGVELSADNKYLLVSECTAWRITKLNLEQVRKAVASGNSAGLRREVFADRLPGEPDNIRLFNGDIYIGMALTRAKGPLISDRLSGYPLIRKAMGRLLYLTSLAIDFVRTSLWRHPALEELSFQLYSGHIVYNMVPKAGAIVILDGKSGALKKILGSEKFGFISEAIVDSNTGDIYFGSFKNKFIGKLKAEHLK